MNNPSQNSKEKQKKRDPDLAAAEIAMKRAARKARERAWQTGAGVAVWKEGRIVQEWQDAHAET